MQTSTLEKEVVGYVLRLIVIREDLVGFHEGFFFNGFCDVWEFLVEVVVVVVVVVFFGMLVLATLSCSCFWSCCDSIIKISLRVYNEKDKNVFV